MGGGPRFGPPLCCGSWSISPHPQPDTRGWQHPRLTTRTAARQAAAVRLVHRARLLCVAPRHDAVPLQRRAGTGPPQPHPLLTTAIPCGQSWLGDLPTSTYSPPVHARTHPPTTHPPSPTNTAAAAAHVFGLLVLTLRPGAPPDGPWASPLTPRRPPRQVCYHVQMLYLFVPLLLGTKPKAPDAGRRRGGENGAVEHANGHANGNAHGNANGRAIKTE